MRKMRQFIAVFLALGSMFWALEANATAVTSTATSTSSTTTSIGTAQPGELATGLNQGTTEINTILDQVITQGVTISSSLKTYADGFAGALAAITIVLAGIRFAGTHNPINAWIALFEEIGMLGIFAGFYVSYTTLAPGFYTSFSSMAAAIAPDINGKFGAFGATGAAFYDGASQAIHAAGWTDVLAVIMNALPVIGAFLVMVVTSIVITFYTHLGQIQAAVGIVMGQIAFALGFSSYTRSYFQSWLNYMISAGMYIVVAAILIKLVGSSVATALTTVSGTGYLTNQGGALVFDLAFFMLLLAFEIPKMANMFTGGGNVTGSGLGKVASIAQKAAGLL